MGMYFNPSDITKFIIQFVIQYNLKASTLLKAQACVTRPSPCERGGAGQRQELYSDLHDVKIVSSELWTI